jgi:hypothetical protein
MNERRQYYRFCPYDGGRTVFFGRLGYGVEDGRDGALTPSMGKKFCHLQSIQIGSGAHPAFYSMGTFVILPWV